MSPPLLRSALRAVLSFLRTTTRQRPTVIVTGHSASVALGLAAEWSGLWQELVLVAPTWRGPLPMMTGWPSQRFRWLRQHVATPFIGPLLYRLNTSRPVLHLMLRRQVWVAPALLTPARIREQQLLVRRPGARFASLAFVSGGLDPADDRACCNARCRWCWLTRPHHAPGQRCRLWAGRRLISSA